MTAAGPPPPHRWRRRLIVLCLVFGIASLLVAVSPTRRPAPLKLPDPNGYDDLVKAGSLIHGDWPNKGDFAKAKVNELEAFVEANSASLELARVGLGRECVVAFENSHEGLEKHLKDLGSIRNVARLLMAEAIVHEADGRAIGAARSCRDVLELGQAMSRGGMSTDVAVMSVVQDQSITRLRLLLGKLSIETTSAILRDLESLDRRRVSPDDVEDRRVFWYQGAFNTFQRTMFRWSGIERKGQADEMNMSKTSLDRIGRTMRFFMVGLAIHAYHEDRKAWPRSVKDLVPDYLASAPVDPATGKPIDYPANPSGELTDDLTAIARPDGEVAPRP